MITDEMKVAAVKAYTEVDGKCRPAAMQKALEAALSTLPIAGEGKAPEELSGPLQWAMADAFEASAADTTAGKMIAVYDVVRSALISSPGKDGGQEVEAVAEIDWRAMYLHARAAQLKTGGSDENAAGHFADAANRAIRSALRPQPASTALVEALRAIETYGSDTLSGSIGEPAGIAWFRDGVREMRNRARSALASVRSTSKEEETRP